ncbi:MAG: DUF5654 family protein [bacterium]|nr:DUF5654 family protein [Candidatus Jorgensenbacteria bacterium]
MRNFKEKLSRGHKRFRREGRNQAITMVITSFSFVAGLAWNEAIKSFIEFFFPSEGGRFAKLIYALLVTLIVVLVSYVLTSMRHKDHDGDSNHIKPEIGK